MPRGTWWRAMLGLAVLWVGTRFVAPRAANVNVTWTYWFGWEARLVGFPLYVGILALTVAGVFLGLELFLRAVRPCRGSGSPCC